MKHIMMFSIIILVSLFIAEQINQSEIRPEQYEWVYTKVSECPLIIEEAMYDDFISQKEYGHIKASCKDAEYIKLKYNIKNSAAQYESVINDNGYMRRYDGDKLIRELLSIELIEGKYINSNDLIEVINKVTK